MVESTELSTFYRVFPKSCAGSAANHLESLGALMFSVEPSGQDVRLGFMCHRPDWERLKQEAEKLQ